MEAAGGVKSCEMGSCSGGSDELTPLNNKWK